MHILNPIMDFLSVQARNATILKIKCGGSWKLAYSFLLNRQLFQQNRTCSRRKQFRIKSLSSAGELIISERKVLQERKKTMKISSILAFGGANADFCKDNNQQVWNEKFSMKNSRNFSKKFFFQYFSGMFVSEHVYMEWLQLFYFELTSIRPCSWHYCCTFKRNEWHDDGWPENCFDQHFWKQQTRLNDQHSRFSICFSF